MKNGEEEEKDLFRIGTVLLTSKHIVGKVYYKAFRWFTINIPLNINVSLDEIDYIWNDRNRLNKKIYRNILEFILLTILYVAGGAACFVYDLILFFSLIDDLFCWYVITAIYEWFQIRALRKQTHICFSCHGAAHIGRYRYTIILTDSSKNIAEFERRFKDAVIACNPKFSDNANPRIRLCS